LFAQIAWIPNQVGNDKSEEDCFLPAGRQAGFALAMTEKLGYLLKI